MSDQGLFNSALDTAFYLLDTPAALTRGVLSGHLGERRSVEEFADDWGLADQGTLSPMKAFGLALATDPLMLIPGAGMISRGMKAGLASTSTINKMRAASKAAEAASLLSKAAKPLEMADAVDGLSKVAKAVKTAKAIEPVSYSHAASLAAPVLGGAILSGNAEQAMAKGEEPDPLTNALGYGLAFGPLALGAVVGGARIFKKHPLWSKPLTNSFRFLSEEEMPLGQPGGKDLFPSGVSSLTKLGELKKSLRTVNPAMTPQELAEVDQILDTLSLASRQVGAHPAVSMNIANNKTKGYVNIANPTVVRMSPNLLMEADRRAAYQPYRVWAHEITHSLGGRNPEAWEEISNAIGPKIKADNVRDYMQRLMKLNDEEINQDIMKRLGLSEQEFKSLRRHELTSRRIAAGEDPGHVARTTVDPKIGFTPESRRQALKYMAYMETRGEEGVADALATGVNIHPQLVEDLAKHGKLLEPGMFGKSDAEVAKIIREIDDLDTDYISSLKYLKSKGLASEDQLKTLRELNTSVRRMPIPEITRNLADAVELGTRTPMKDKAAFHQALADIFANPTSAKSMVLPAIGAGMAATSDENDDPWKKVAAGALMSTALIPLAAAISKGRIFKGSSVWKAGVADDFRFAKDFRQHLPVPDAHDLMASGHNGLMTIEDYRDLVKFSPGKPEDKLRAIKALEGTRLISRQLGLNPTMSLALLDTRTAGAVNPALPESIRVSPVMIDRAVQAGHPGDLYGTLLHEYVHSAGGRNPETFEALADSLGGKIRKAKTDSYMAKMRRVDDHEIRSIMNDHNLSRNEMIQVLIDEGFSPDQAALYVPDRSGYSPMARAQSLKYMAPLNTRGEEAVAEALGDAFRLDPRIGHQLSLHGEIFSPELGYTDAMGRSTQQLSEMAESFYKGRSKELLQLQEAGLASEAQLKELQMLQSRLGKTPIPQLAGRTADMIETAAGENVKDKLGVAQALSELWTNPSTARSMVLPALGAGILATDDDDGDPWKKIAAGAMMSTAALPLGAAVGKAMKAPMAAKGVKFINAPQIQSMKHGAVDLVTLAQAGDAYAPYIMKGIGGALRNFVKNPNYDEMTQMVFDSVFDMMHKKYAKAVQMLDHPEDLKKLAVDLDVPIDEIKNQMELFKEGHLPRSVMDRAIPQKIRQATIDAINKISKREKALPTVHDPEGAAAVAAPNTTGINADETLGVPVELQNHARQYATQKPEAYTYRVQQPNGLFNEYTYTYDPPTEPLEIAEVKKAMWEGNQRILDPESAGVAPPMRDLDFLRDNEIFRNYIMNAIENQSPGPAMSLDARTRMQRVADAILETPNFLDEARGMLNVNDPTFQAALQELKPYLIRSLDKAKQYAAMEGQGVRPLRNPSSKFVRYWSLWPDSQYLPESSPIPTHPAAWTPERAVLAKARTGPLAELLAGRKPSPTDEMVESLQGIRRRPANPFFEEPYPQYAENPAEYYSDEAIASRLWDKPWAKQEGSVIDADALMRALTGEEYAIQRPRQPFGGTERSKAAQWAYEDAIKHLSESEAQKAADMAIRRSATGTRQYRQFVNWLGNSTFNDVLAERAEFLNNMINNDVAKEAVIRSLFGQRYDEIAPILSEEIKKSKYMQDQLQAIKPTKVKMDREPITGAQALSRLLAGKDSRVGVNPQMLQELGLMPTPFEQQTPGALMSMFFNLWQQLRDPKRSFDAGVMQAAAQRIMQSSAAEAASKTAQNIIKQAKNAAKTKGVPAVVGAGAMAHLYNMLTGGQDDASRQEVSL